MRYFFFILLVLFSCEKKDDVLPTKNEAVDQILIKVTKQLRSKLGLLPFGTGARMMDKVKMLSLSFMYPESIDLETGRAILIQAADIFVAAINAEGKIRPYLDTVPFTPQNVQVWIFFRDDKKKPNCVSSMRITDGVLKYSVIDLENPNLEIDSRESYEEAVQKLQQNSRTSRAA